MKDTRIQKPLSQEDEALYSKLAHWCNENDHFIVDGGTEYYCERVPAPTQAELDAVEIVALENWFSDYDKKVSEHLRCQRLGIDCHHDIAMLDAQAEEKRARLGILLHQGESK